MSILHSSSDERSLPTPQSDSEQSAATKASKPAAASAPLAIFSANLRGEFVACNSAFAKLLGYSPLELIGRDLSAMFALTPKASRNDSQQLCKEILTTASKQDEYDCQLFARPKSGGTLAVRLSATLLRDSASLPSSLFAVVAPIAEAEVTSASGEARIAPGIISRRIDDTEFILASPVMHKFMSLVDRVASHTETVLITGETGTGKELIARTIHEASDRRSRPWVDINCAALPENLVESELFGYEKGAFSGADTSKPGLFELADRGTLFLDEIGELQLQTQVKLLRVLDGQPFYRLGGHRKIKVDVRIVAATNQDLEAAVREGRFRQDLFHRLGQFQLRVPPLRERPEDIVALAEHFLRLKAPRKNFSEQAISALLSHSWPGNIRELRNLVARMAMESPAGEIDFSRLTVALTGEPSALRQTASMPVSNLDSMEEQMIIKALERTGGQRTQAAEQLGISRRTLSRKLKEYNINFAPGDSTASLGFISNEQQKFFRARVEIPVTIRNSQGEKIVAQAKNLSTGGMGLDGLKEPLRFAGMVDVSFVLPDSDVQFQAKARLMWVGDEGRVGIRFAVIEPALFEELQHWTNRKMKEEGWDFPA
ncbi:MAG TPA: sigma 54-interacting transcriptional regulator [Candidatus Dormibacteraeota bacterium]|nr:sigma 54-interacting transcriptional regulator [Candidatus Dormibacteraeota bacterium]